MQLRVFRSFTWELDCPISEVRLGGKNPMKLVSHDELQFYGQGMDGEIGWTPIMVVEGLKPTHPDELREQAIRERYGKDPITLSEDIRVGLQNLGDQE